MLAVRTQFHAETWACTAHCDVGHHCITLDNIWLKIALLIWTPCTESPHPRHISTFRDDRVVPAQQTSDWFSTPFLQHVRVWHILSDQWSSAGVIEDPGNRKFLARMLRVHTSKSPFDLISIHDYAARMQPEQEKILYICSSTLEDALTSPYLERLMERSIEVILFTDPMDEYMMQVCLNLLALLTSHQICDAACT